jgi:hypothetical protein
VRGSSVLCSPVLGLHVVLVQVVFMRWCSLPGGDVGEMVRSGPS